MWCINLNDNWYPMEDVNERIEHAFSQPEKSTVVVSPKIGVNVFLILILLDNMAVTELTYNVILSLQFN